MVYESVIGLEIHCELLTETKVFCSCKNAFGGTPNTRACPICSGMPGALPSLNKEAVILAAKAGFAMDCAVNNRSSFDRKNYFYPDLPKAYQITQFREPICTNGHVRIAGEKTIRIKQIHIEEDAGKLVHDGELTKINYNRCGVPLIEIVTEPDFSTADEVRDFVERIALRLKYAGVCDAKMEEGSLRVDVNISLMEKGSDSLGTRAEIKNLSSLRAITRTIIYEINRQSKILDNNGKIFQETRRFDEASGKTVSLRSKEEAHNYRYLPEPDLPPIWISDAELRKIRDSMPEMPQKRYIRYTKRYGLPADDARLILSSREFSDFYDAAVKENSLYRQTASMMLVELNHHLNENSAVINDVRFTPKELAELVTMSCHNIVSKNAAKEILAVMFYEGTAPEIIAKERGLIINNDIAAIESAVDEILKDNASAVAEYKNGSKKILGFLIGRVMRRIPGSADPKTARELIMKKLTQY